MATQSVYDFARWSEYSLFFCVRPHLILPLSSPLPSKRAVLPTELTVTFCHSVFLFFFFNALVVSGKFPTGGWQVILFSILQSVPIFTLSPRFILSIREFYVRDVLGRRDEEIDTEFDLSSGRGAGGTTFVPVDVEQNEGSDNIEEVTWEVQVTTRSE